MNSGFWGMPRLLRHRDYGDLASECYLDVVNPRRVPASNIIEPKPHPEPAKAQTGAARIEVILGCGDISKPFAACTRGVGTTPPPDQAP
jgi:hypothetical protein